MRKTTRLVPSDQQAYADHVASDWEAVQNKERFYMPNTLLDSVALEKNDTPSVEQLGAPASTHGGVTDLKAFNRVANVIVEGVDLSVIATSTSISSWAYRSDGMSCGNCGNVTTDTDVTFCPICGVGYVIRAYVGIAP